MPFTEAEAAYIYRTDGPPITDQHQRLEYAPTAKQKIGQFTIICLILNRTIGSGIFSTPHRIFGGTGCVGGFFMIWLAGILISFCGLYVWLECGLSMPQRTVEGEDAPRGVPRSGGEKNWLETMFPNPKFRTTCCYSIMFILLYNLSGNAIAFGIQIMIASGRYVPAPDNPPDRGTAAGIAVAALSLAILLHIFSRRGGILVNNGFAIVKVLLLIVVVGLGIAKAAGRFPKAGISEREALDNFTVDVWKTKRNDVSSYSSSLILCMYTFSGFEQPFYVLVETQSPRRRFPRATIIAMVITAVLFMSVNVAYLLAIPKSEIIPDAGLPGQADLATLFFQRLFDDQMKATRITSGLIAFSIFGNIVVMTFTAARVKQEIAKEGILPKSLMLATSHATPYGLFKRWRGRSYNSSSPITAEEIEQSPVAAFVLHWFSSILLILVTLPIQDPRTTYYVLVSIYSYVIITLLGFWVSIGLIWTKLGKNDLDWKNRGRYRPWLSPMHAVIYALACLFVLVAAFIPPSEGSPYHENVVHIKWYIVPSIGISAPLWGYLWYLGLLLYQDKTERELTVSRTAYIEVDDECPHEYLQKAEIIDHSWPPRYGGKQPRRVGIPRLRLPHRTSQTSENESQVTQIATSRPNIQSHAPRNEGWRSYGFSDDDATTSGNVTWNQAVAR